MTAVSSQQFVIFEKNKQIKIKFLYYMIIFSAQVKFCLPKYGNEMHKNEKYCPDITELIHMDAIEQQRETSSPTDYFITSCFPSVLLLICLPLIPGISTLFLSVPHTAKHFHLLITDCKEYKKGAAKQICVMQQGNLIVLQCLRLSGAHTCLFMDTAIL